MPPQESQDDELFKFQLAIRWGANDNPAARALWPSLIRSVGFVSARDAAADAAASGEVRA